MNEVILTFLSCSIIITLPSPVNLLVPDQMMLVRPWREQTFTFRTKGLNYGLIPKCNQNSESQDISHNYFYLSVLVLEFRGQYFTPFLVTQCTFRHRMNNLLSLKIYNSLNFKPLTQVVTQKSNVVNKSRS